MQKLSENVCKLTSDITRKAESAPRPVRTAVLRHVAELGPPPESDPERLTWWAAMLLGVKDADKLQARSDYGTTLPLAPEVYAQCSSLAFKGMQSLWNCLKRTADVFRASADQAALLSVDCCKATECFVCRSPQSTYLASNAGVLCAMTTCNGTLSEFVQLQFRWFAMLSCMLS
jgi:hypothetical protein